MPRAPQPGLPLQRKNDDHNTLTVTSPPQSREGIHKARWQSTSSKSISVPQLAGAISVSLPIEIFGAILEELIDDKQFLLQSRLLSKNLRAVADSCAFRRLTVWCTGPSAAKRKEFLENVANVPSLAVHVKEIIWREETGVVNPDPMEAFSSSIRSLTKFPNVNTLRFWFPNVWNEPSEDDDLEMSSLRDLQIRILNELAEFYSRTDVPRTALRSLEIGGLITLPNESLRSDAFKELVKPIPNLIIGLVTNDGENFYHSDHGYSTFLNVDLTGILNAARNLTSLILESDIITFYDWDKVATLPNLRHLELRNFVFGHLFSPEDFILRHKSTLRQLDLIDCWLDTDPHTQFGGPAKARVWKDVFETFEQELLELVDMVFKPLPGVKYDEYGLREFDGYVWLDTEGGYKKSFDMEESPCERDGEDDRLAYGSLQEAIKRRRGKQSSI